MEHRSWAKQAWTIAKIELGRAFFSRRALWVYLLALIPAVAFFAHGVHLRIRRQMLYSTARVEPAALDALRTGDTAEGVIQRLGKPASDVQWESRTQVRGEADQRGVTTHTIQDAEARYVRLNVTFPNRSGDGSARIYEVEVYGENPAVNLARGRPANSSKPCTPDQGPEKAFNGSTNGGRGDNWCSGEMNRFLQVDLGSLHKLKRIVVKHASAGGEREIFDTVMFTIQASTDNTYFSTVAEAAGPRFVEEIGIQRRLVYFDGRREATLEFKNGKLAANRMNTLLDFEEDRNVFAGIFQYFYLRLAIFFGCLGIFMNLFRGEMLDKTLHFWFLAPARREVLLAGKYGAGLIASTVIFAGGTLLSLAILLLMHDPVEVRAYWNGPGQMHVFWYAAAAVLGCVGYGSVFLTAGLLLRNPIIPAAVILGWEGINGFLPVVLQKLSVLYYLQSLCPVPAPTDKEMPALLQLLLAPAAPASRGGAIGGIIVLTTFVLWIASRAIRRMEVSYGTE